MTILDPSTPHGIGVRAPALALLLGKLVGQVPDLAKLTSPVYQASENDPPIFIAHGDQDYQVPVNQSLELKSVFEKNNSKVVLEIISGAPVMAHRTITSQILLTRLQSFSMTF